MFCQPGSPALPCVIILYCLVADTTLYLVCSVQRSGFGPDDVMFVTLGAHATLHYGCYGHGCVAFTPHRHCHPLTANLLAPGVACLPARRRTPHPRRTLPDGCSYILNAVIIITFPPTLPVLRTTVLALTCRIGALYYLGGLTFPPLLTRVIIC